MVSGVARTWKRVGQLQPLAERWQAGIDELSKLSGELFPGPPSETRFDDLMNRLAELRTARQPPPQDPATVAAERDLFELIKQHDALVLQIREAQRGLAHIASDWRYQALGLPSANCLSTPPPLRRTEPGEGPVFQHVWEVREVEKKLRETVDWLRSIVTEIATVRGFANAPKDHQAIELCRALFSENAALKTRLKDIEAQLGAIAAKLDAHLNPKRRKDKYNATRSHARTRQAPRHAVARMGKQLV